ncbi:anillin-like [Prorops nasuta]|uniref:anillin-like n=1 Tax=Prorops nasuta TaxID=863751 RepID=UPI0034CD7DD0
MVINEESFTCRMLRRAGVKKGRDYMPSYSASDLKRRLSILQSLEGETVDNKRNKGLYCTPGFISLSNIQKNPSKLSLSHENSDKASTSNDRSIGKLDSRFYAPFLNKSDESHTSHQTNVYGGTSDRKICKTNAIVHKIDNETSKSSLNIKDEVQMTPFKYKDSYVPDSQLAGPQLVVIQQKNVDIPQKLQVDVGKIKALVTENKALPKHIINIQRSSAHYEENFGKNYLSSMSLTSVTNLTQEIKDLEKEIEYLEFRRDVCEFEQQVDCCEKINLDSSFEKGPPCKPKRTSLQKFNVDIENINNDKENKFDNSIKPENFSLMGNEGEIPYIDDVKIDLHDTQDELMGESIHNEKSIKNEEPFIPRYIKNKQKTPKILPNLESTRRSSNFDSHKRSKSPSRAETTISSITIPHSRTLHSINSTIPFDVERFLEDALGEELYNTSVTYAPTDERTFSQFNASELLSDVTSPHQTRKVLRLPITDPRPNLNNTFNRTRTLYKSLTQRIKKKLRPSVNRGKYDSRNPSITFIAVRENCRVQELLQELDINQTLIYQASKALNMCCTMKEFLAGPEHVESERLLLLSGLKKKACLEEIKKISTVENNNEYCHDRAEVIIKDINLPLKEMFLYASRYYRDSQEWFVVTVSYGPFVWATQAVTCHITDSTINFPGSVSIPNLTPDFKIMVKVYNLRLKSPKQHEEPKRYHCNWKSTYESAKKFWKKQEKPERLKLQQTPCTTISETSFTLCGWVELSLRDISSTSPWCLMTVSSDTILEGTVCFNFSCKLHISVTHAGFITHGDEAGGYAVWNRRWCMLEGHNLKFWNYPQDQEEKAPAAVIDLMQCISKEATVVDRTLCARPRTLLVKTARPRKITDQNSILLECNESHTIVRNLLSCDTSDDLIVWRSKLNHVIFSLREWNAISLSNSNMQISDL